MHQLSHSPQSFDTLNLSFPDSEQTQRIASQVYREKFQPYMELAVKVTFDSFPGYLEKFDSMAYRVISLNGEYEYESLRVSAKLSFKSGRLANKSFVPGVNFFNINSSSPVEERASLDLHDHVRPIGVLPMHPDGRIDQVAYEMYTERHDPMGKCLTINHDYVHYGSMYGFDNPVFDLHSVHTHDPVVSYIIYQIDGDPLNPREPNTKLEANPKRKKDLIEIALNAHQATLTSQKATMERRFQAILESERKSSKL